MGSLLFFHLSVLCSRCHSVPLFLWFFVVEQSPVDKGVERLDPGIEPQYQSLKRWAVEYRRPVNVRTFIPAPGNAGVDLTAI